MKITINPDEDFVREMKKKLRANGKHCPCALVKTPDTKCMCKEFREQTTEGWCRCGLYYKGAGDEDERPQV